MSRLSFARAELKGDITPGTSGSVLRNPRRGTEPTHSVKKQASEAAMSPCERVLHRLSLLSYQAQRNGNYAKAIRAEELIGKELGMFQETVKFEWDGDCKKLTDNQLDKVLQQLRSVIQNPPSEPRNGNEALAQAEMFTPNRVLHRLSILSREAQQNGRYSAAVRGEELIGRALGMFADRLKQVEWDGDFTKLTKKQAEKLNQLFEAIAKEAKKSPNVGSNGTQLGDVTAISA